MKKNKVGSINQRQKSISLSLIREIEKFQKSEQLKQNIKFGRKAKTITFVLCTKSPKKLAKFILEGSK